MQNQLKTFLVCLFAGFCQVAMAGDISVSATAPFHDALVIPQNIQNECTDLGSNLVTSTQQSLVASGWKVTLSDQMQEQAGAYLKLEILTASSAGNPVTGRQKAVNILATLYKDGKQVDSYNVSRSTRGGFLFGRYKGSCAMYYRCVETLGSDVAEWINKSKAKTL